MIIRRPSPSLFTLLFALTVAPLATAAPPSAKIDRALRASLRTAIKTRHVIITTAPAQRMDIRRALEAANIVWGTSALLRSPLISGRIF
jgi:hypothetical protein